MILLGLRQGDLGVGVVEKCGVVIWFEGNITASEKCQILVVVADG